MINIGETAVLATADNGNGNLLVAQQATLPVTSVLQSMSFYVTNAAGRLRLGLYDSTGPGGGPGEKLAETAEITPVVGWNSSPVVSQVTLQPGSYWLSYFPSSNSLAFGKNISGQGAYYTQMYGVMPATFSTFPTKETVHWSLYATLSNTTPTPTATPTPTPGMINIGETTVLSTADNGNGNLLVAQQATLSVTSVLQSMSFYVTNAAGKLRLGLYDSTGPGGGPGKKLAETAEITPVVGWNSSPVVSQVTLQPGSSWLSYFPSSNSLAFGRNLSGQGAYYTQTYGVMPATFSTFPTKETVHWSLYATLSNTTPTPTATPTPAPGMINIGETAVLATADNGNGNLLVAQQATLPVTSVLQSMSFYVTNAAGKLRLGLYDSTGPGGGPGKKLAETAEITPVVGWNSSPVVSQVTLQPGSYWLSYFPSSNSLAFGKNLSGQGAYYTQTYGVMPATFSTFPTKETVHWSLYATLSNTTPTPTATPTPTPGMINIGETAVLDYCRQRQRQSLSRSASHAVSYFRAAKHIVLRHECCGQTAAWSL